MAIRQPTVTQINDNLIRIVWTGLLNGDFGGAVNWLEYADRSVQVGGTFGAGGSVSLEGSNDGTNFIILTDPQANVITKTSAAIEQVLEGTYFVQPHVTAGDGTTSLTVTVVGRKA